MKTKLCDLLGIQYPVMSGGMQWLSEPAFVAAVSNAGGIGTLSAASQGSVKNLKNAIQRVKELTDKPFIVNVSMFPSIAPDDMALTYFETIVEEGVKIVETSGRSPEAYIPMLKAAGIKIIHKVPAVRFAKKAERIGVDAVTLIGCECAGMPGLDEVGTFVLTAKAAKELSIPIIAGGGIANGRGLAAALALGASGVVMGTRMLATVENTIHENFKKWMISADERSTVLIQKSLRNPARVINNETAKRVLELEKNGASPERLAPLIDSALGRENLLNGTVEEGIFAMGECVGLIDGIKPVKEVIEEMVSDAEKILSDLNKSILTIEKKEW